MPWPRWWGEVHTNTIFISILMSKREKSCHETNRLSLTSLLKLVFVGSMLGLSFSPLCANARDSPQGLYHCVVGACLVLMSFSWMMKTEQAGLIEAHCLAWAISIYSRAVWFCVFYNQFLNSCLFPSRQL